MRRLLFPLIFLFLITTGFESCVAVDGDNEGTPDESVTQREQDVSGKLAIALGGVSEGKNQITIGGALNSLEFTTEDIDLIQLSIPENFDSYLSARGAEVSPLAEGIAYATPIVNSRSQDPVEITIPPQKLIQVLVGEARGQIAREATLDANDEVKSSSVSVTGDAIGVVIRNRINLINDDASIGPGFFNAEPDQYESNQPISFYEAIIEAENQFNPVDPDDLTHPHYLNAADRSLIEEDDDLTAYDQAVLTAAYVFNGDTVDPTGGAFAFYSPTANQYEALTEALGTADLELPEGAGTSDSNFPSLAPIQVLILPGIASATTRTDRPSFVFIRERNPTDPAVTDEP